LKRLPAPGDERGAQHLHAAVVRILRPQADAVAHLGTRRRFAGDLLVVPVGIEASFAVVGRPLDEHAVESAAEIRTFELSVTAFRSLYVRQDVTVPPPRRAT